MKDYLVYENNRNHVNHEVQTELVKRAFGKTCDVLVAHHITFERVGQEPIEIPSADTLIFDHDIMGHIFGVNAYALMKELAMAPSAYREPILKRELAKLPPL
jgi:hypothetical protein